ncbi:MAG TPA: SAM-dependent methyltransferase, partial [Candidatus Gracilibacteria bacterium]|nr:SAM-dependent methyltransferase [Candidatus Gracilibacteria bacterium]
PIPGPAAFLTALQGAGIPINQFWYLGFLPVKKGRQTLFKKMQECEMTMVFYESVHRIEKTLSEMSTYFGEDCQIVVGRELTKLYEEFFRGTIAEGIAHFKNPKGEFVVIIPARHVGRNLGRIRELRDLSGESRLSRFGIGRKKP